MLVEHLSCRKSEERHSKKAKLSTRCDTNPILKDGGINQLKRRKNVLMNANCSDEPTSDKNAQPWVWHHEQLPKKCSSKSSRVNTMASESSSSDNDRVDDDEYCLTVNSDIEYETINNYTVSLDENAQKSKKLFA